MLPSRSFSQPSRPLFASLLYPAGISIRLSIYAVAPFCRELAAIRVEHRQCPARRCPAGVLYAEVGLLAPAALFVVGRGA